MAISVNGELIPDALVAHEFEQLLKTQKLGGRDPEQLRLMAACAVVDRVLIRQLAELHCGQQGQVHDDSRRKTHWRKPSNFWTTG